MKKLNLESFKEFNLKSLNKVLGGGCTPTGSGTYDKNDVCFTYKSDWKTQTSSTSWTTKFCGIGGCVK